MLQAGSEMTLTLWHNPRCSKSRQTLALLIDRGHTPTLRLMLDDPPSAAEITDVTHRLGLSLRDVTRKGEALYKSLSLGKADDATLLTALTNHPILIERPILLTGTKAAIGRPPETVLDIL